MKIYSQDLYSLFVSDTEIKSIAVMILVVRYQQPVITIPEFIELNFRFHR